MFAQKYKNTLTGSLNFTAYPTLDRFGTKNYEFIVNLTKR